MFFFLLLFIIFQEYIKRRSTRIQMLLAEVVKDLFSFGASQGGTSLGKNFLRVMLKFWCLFAVMSFSPGVFE